MSELQSIQKAVKEKGKPKVREATMIALKEGFTKEARRRIRQAKNISIEIWLPEYLSSPAYKEIDAPICLELGIKVDDLRNIMGEGIKEAIAKPDVSYKNPLANTGRNSLCPCGSGLKYKKCHGRES